MFLIYRTFRKTSDLHCGRSIEGYLSNSHRLSVVNMWEVGPLFSV